MMIQTLKTARTVSTPIVLITTTDQTSTIDAIVQAFSPDSAKNPPPIVLHDVLRGFVSGNGKTGKEAIDASVPKNDFPGAPAPGLNPVEALAFAMNFPKGTIFIMRNAHKLWNEPPILQGITLIRDVFRQNNRMFVLLAPAAMLPSEVVQDVVVIDDPLPDTERLGAVLDEQVLLARDVYKELEAPTPEERVAIIAALRGLNEYAAEATVALAIADSTYTKIDPSFVWLRKRSILQQVKGIKWDGATVTFNDVGGIESMKQFGHELFNGNRPPRVIVRIDEIEKQMAGIAGDNTGVSQDILGTILRDMEDNEWGGVVAVGPPGATKTLFSRALGATYKVPTIELDLGAVKESLVGNTEANIRAAMKVLKAIGGKDILWVATANKLEILPPELRRRFKYGVWFFDLPSAEEQEAIWAVNLRLFGLDPTAERPDYTNWTGAEIRNACELASNLRKSPAEVARYIVPVAKADWPRIEALREAADDKFLSASYAGPYRKAKDRVTQPAISTGRSYVKES